ncbi:hypothetical protein D3C71_2092040 [compost metagenome]
MLEKLLERALVLQQRHAQVARLEQQAGAAGRIAPRAREQQVVFAAVGRLGVAEAGFFEADALADQPAGQAVPDHQQAFHQEVVRILEP